LIFNIWDSSTWAGLAARCLIIINILSFIFTRENNNILQLRTILHNEVSVLESFFSDSWYGSPLIFSEMNFHHFAKKSPKLYGEGNFLKRNFKNCHIMRKKSMKLSRFLEDLGRFFYF
jgi:hypothetical protein